MALGRFTNEEIDGGRVALVNIGERNIDAFYGEVGRGDSEVFE